jgi:predicted permease
MLFRVVATQKPASFSDGRFALGYAVATVAVFLFTRSAALPPRTGWRDDDPQARAAAGSQATAFGLNTAHGNIGYLGIPLVLELGRDYLPTLILAMICDIFLVITLGIALLELDRRRGRPGGPGRAPRLGHENRRARAGPQSAGRGHRARLAVGPLGAAAAGCARQLQPHPGRCRRAVRAVRHRRLAGATGASWSIGP